MNVEQWIPFREGEYLVEQAFLVTPDQQMAAMENTVIEVYQDNRGQRHLNGSGRVENYRVVELMEEADVLDLVLDFGDGIRYRLPDPTLSAGKLFTPGVKSMMQFVPTAPWTPISNDEWNQILNDGA
jgi:hypothetical protein